MTLSPISTRSSKTPVREGVADLVGLRAISIRQPWAHAIVHLGKDIENRSWRCVHRGPALIHAAKGMTKAEFEDGQDFIRRITGVVIDRDSLQFGGIVGRADIVDCIGWDQRRKSDWFMGPYGIVLRDAEPLPFMPCKGALGFFVPDLPVAPSPPRGEP